MKHDPGVEHVSVLIVGSGFAGLGAAIRLEQAGRSDFLVIERSPDVGGTWRDNTYPGAVCDVPPISTRCRSRLTRTGLGCSPRKARSRTICAGRPSSPAPSIGNSSTARCCRRAGTLTTPGWEVQTTRGAFTATILLTALGALSQPKLPDIAGVEDFQGRLLHTAHWDAQVDLSGRRVAVIGTGASAIQLMPALADHVDHLDLYQRTRRGSCRATTGPTGAWNGGPSDTSPATSGWSAGGSTPATSSPRSASAMPRRSSG